MRRMQAGMRLLLVAAMLAVMLAAGMSSAAAEENAVAKIGETKYTTLDDAIAAADAGATIELLTDSTLTKTFYKSLTFTGAYTVNLDVYGWRYSGNLVFDGAKFNVTSDLDSPVANNGEAGKWFTMVLGGSITAKNGADVTFNFDSNGGVNCAIYYAESGAKINVESGSHFSIYGENTAGVGGQGIQLGATANDGIFVTGGSTFLIDGTNRGYVNSPTIYVEDSTFTVQNCTSNASNGGEFTAVNSTISFLNNKGHGLSAGNVRFENATVNCNNNAYYGITYSGNMTMDATSTLTANDNGYGYTGGGLRAYGTSYVEAEAVVKVQNNKRNGVENYGSFTFAEGAKVTITGNNEPSTNGGGIYNGGTLILPTQTIIMNNYAEQTGGGICNAGSVTIPSGVQFYNNHAGNAGDDLYNRASATAELPSVGTAWYLDGDPDCTYAIDGWYDDAENARWEAHAAEDGANHIQKVSQGTITGLTALKAAHGIRKLDLIPQDPPTDLPIDKTASERLDEDYRAEVTLTMPSYAEPLETDVVFVLDKSTSTQVEEDALSMLDRLRAQVEGKQAIVKVGVVIFNRQANTNGLLMDLTSEYETIKNEIGKDISSGTNSHAGLMAGMDLLNGGGAANSRKYLIFVSDGKTYIFGEEPTAIPLENADRTNAFAGPDNWATKYGNDTPPASWDAYFAEIAAQIAADGNQYYVPYGTNDRYIRYEERLEHANSVDVALYRTNEVYQAAKSAGYRVFAKLKSSDIGANYLWGPAFMEYLSGGQEVSFEGIGDDMLYLYGAGTTITDVIGYGETAEHGPYDFGFVDENLMLKYGTVDDQGNFTPFGDYNPYCVSSETDDNGNVHYYFGQGLAEDGAGYAFELIYYPNGVPGATAENDQKEHFTLTFHRNIRLGEQVQLTYNVELGENYRNKQDANLFDGLETNKNAYIDPVDSEGNAGDRQFFPVPTTEYENVHVAKVWAGDDDAAVRPNSITVTLKEPVGGTIRETSAAVDASRGWAALFLNVRKGWEIEEVQVVLDAGKGSYASSQTAEAGNASNVTLTNTYTKPEPTPTVTPIPTPTPTPAPVLPETVVTIIKVWDDSGYSGRPNAITVRLGVQNDPNYVGYNVELNPNNPNVRVSADGNTWTWSRQIVDRAYVAEEVAVPGYASKVEQNGNTFVITNTYMPATGDDTPVRTYLLIAGCAAMVLLGAGAWLLHSRRGKRA